MSVAYVLVGETGHGQQIGAYGRGREGYGEQENNSGGWGPARACSPMKGGHGRGLGKSCQGAEAKAWPVSMLGRSEEARAWSQGSRRRSERCGARAHREDT